MEQNLSSKVRNLGQNLKENLSQSFNQNLSPSLKRKRKTKNPPDLRKVERVLLDQGLKSVANKIGLAQDIQHPPTLRILFLSEPQRLRLSFEELGVTYAHFARWLAKLPELPDEYAKELAKADLQFPQMSQKVVSDGIEESLVGATVNHMDEAFFSNGICQAHRGQFSNGKFFTAKALLPRLFDKIEADLQTFEKLAGYLFAQADFSGSFVLDPLRLVREFKNEILMSLDLSKEAQDWELIARAFRNHPTTLVPSLVSDSSNAQVLLFSDESIMEAKTSSFPESSCWQAFFQSYLALFFTEGVYFSNWMPGFFFALPDGRLSFDCRVSPRRISQPHCQWVAEVLLACQRDDIETVLSLLVEAASNCDEIEKASVINEIRFELRYDSRTPMARKIYKILQVASINGIHLPSELTHFFSSLRDMESFVSRHSSSLALEEIIADHCYEGMKGLSSQADLVNLLGNKAHDWLHLFEALPREIKSLVRRLNRPDRVQKISLNEIDQLKNTIEDANKNLSQSILVAAGILGVSIIIAALLA